VCFDDVCYRKVWRQTLALKIAEQSEEKRESTGNYILRNKKLDELFGKDTLTLDIEGVDYILLDEADYIRHSEHPELRAWSLIPWGNGWELASYGLHRKDAEDEEGAAEKKPMFDEVIDFIDIATPETGPQVEKALCETYKTHRELGEKVMNAVFGKLIANNGDISRKRLDKAFLEKVKKNERYQQVFLAYTGHAPTNKAVATLTAQKMLNILMVGSLDTWAFPKLSEVETGDRVKDSNPYFQLFGLKNEAFIQLYKDTTTELVQSALNAKLEAESGEGEETAESGAEEKEDYAEAQ
jgi:hypothetical protein